jgi:WD40 repeat protein
LKKTLTAHEDQIYNVVFTPDNRQLLSTGRDSRVVLWDVEQGKAVAPLNDDTTQQGIIGLALTPDGRSVAFGSVNVHSVALLPLSEMASNDARIKEFSYGKRDTATTITISPDGKTLACGRVSGEEVLFWEVDTAKRKQVLKGKGDRGQVVKFSPDGKLIAISGGPDTEDAAALTANQAIRLWDVQTGELKLTLNGHTSSIWSIDFSPDNTTVATASDDKTIKIWDVQTGALKQTLTGHGGGVRSIAFSPDGKLLASASADKTVKIWNPQTGALIQTLSEHSAGLWGIAFSPDGKWIASAGEDKTIKLWSPS